MKKIMVTLLLLLNSTMSLAAGRFEAKLIFVNCTHQDVQVTNPMDPYKFSLDIQPASNGYSPRVNFTVPQGATLYKYPVALTGFFNGYTDGGMYVDFSGGVRGRVHFSQVDSGSRFVEINIISNSPDIEVFPTRMLHRYGYRKEDGPGVVAIALGCNK